MEFATVWAFSALLLMMIIIAFYFAIFFLIFYVIGWGLTTFWRVIFKFLSI